MSHPLELTVYPFLEKTGRTGEPGYVLRKGRSVSRRFVDHCLPAKRLTDAELAAEAYRQMARAMVESGTASNADGSIVVPGDAAVFGPVRLETSRMGDLKRFATLPHAAETDYA